MEFNMKRTNEKIIECKICGVGSDVMYVDQETELCNADGIIEDQEIIIHQMKEPDDAVKLHKTLESIFGE